LDHGFEPNERIEEHSTNAPELNELSGFTPLQILAAAGLDLLDVAQNLSDKASNADLKMSSSILASCAEALVKRGGRVWIDSPMKARPNRGPPTKAKDKATDSQPMTILRFVDPSDINMEKNKDIMKLLGGTDRLAAVGAKWQRDKVIKGCGQSFLPGKGLSTPIEDSMLPGGSDQSSCAVCWKKFGTIRNRKHVCRASSRYVCEDCSSKSILLDDDARRVTDGQFNLAKCDIDKKVEEDRTKQVEQRSERKARIEKAQAQRYNNPLRAAENDQRAAKEELFGGAIGKAVKNFFMEEVEVEQDSAQAANGQVAGVMDSLNATRQAFDERGQKLDNLVEKTGALKNASVDFAKMAKELRESQEKGIFGW